MSIKTTLTKYGTKGLMFYRRNESAIWAIAGSGMTIAGVVGVGWASTTLTDILDEHEEKIQWAKENLEGKVLNNTIVKIYGQTCIKLTRHYGLWVAMTLLGILAHDHGRVLEHEKALMYALTADRATAAYDKLCSRIEEREGKEKLEQYLNDTTTEEVAYTETDEDGVEEVKHEIKKLQGKDGRIMAALDRVFRLGTTAQFDDINLWNNVPFLQNKEDWYNNMLPILETVTMDQVYRDIGFPITKASKIWCWEIDPDDPLNKKRKISFGISEPISPEELPSGLSQKERAAMYEIYLHFSGLTNIMESEIVDDY